MGRTNIRILLPCFFTILLLSNYLYSQNRHDFGFKRDQNLFVLNEDSNRFHFAWAGGINAVRASEIDLNLDGIKDLVIFEKHGDRLLPFINTELPYPNHYRFAPEYQCAFPNLHNWVIFKDYDNDGKEDIFCYGLAGITIYQNLSDDTLRFRLVTEQLQSFYYNDYTNLYTSPDDYLSIEDLDGDGDLDILNFWLLGKYVHFHKNYAMENSGNAEQFDFRLEDECWGHFEEGGEDNSIILNSNCGQKQDEPLRHIGSTLFVHDFAGNYTPDLILGDVDYPNLVRLYNGGTPEDATMTEVDTLFPNHLNPIWLYSMPVINLLDIDGDGQKELLASPSDPSLTKSQDKNSFWLYHLDTETNEYEKVTESFLQNEMIETGSGAYPVFYDWNQDGLQDLFIANYGSYDSSALHNGYLTSYFSSSITYYQNVGTPEMAVFEYITNNFGNLKSRNYQALYPAFGDFDGNNTIDLLCGNIDGTLLLFTNNSSMGLMPELNAAVAHYATIDVGDYSTPQYFDIDQDGRKDLLIGNRRGQIAFYRNTSNGIPDFTFVTDTLGGVDVRNEEISYFGFSVPCFFKNNRNETVLFCGNEQGNISYYDQIDQNLSTVFRLKEEKMFEVLGNNRRDIMEGIRTGAAVADLNNDDYLDLIVGNYAGGVSYFEGITPPPIDISLQDYSKFNQVTIYPNPATHFVNVRIDDKKSVIRQVYIYDITGKMVESFTTTNNEASTLIQLNISHLKRGIYLIRVLGDYHYNPTKKLIISR